VCERALAAFEAWWTAQELSRREEKTSKAFGT
jgi:hypothetical protein